MKDEEITKEQLLAELDKLRQENKELKIAQIEGKGIPKLSEWSSPSRWFSAGRPELIISQWPEPQPAVDHLEKYKFSDLVDIPFIQQLLDSFYFATGIPYGLQDENNNILCGIGWQDICTQFHRLCPQTECRCKQSDRYIAAHLRDRAYVGYKCMNGLMDYGTPIIVEDQHLATIFLGQFLHQPPEEDFFRRQAQEYGFDEEAYLEALRQVPIIPEEQIESIMRFYSQLGRFLATMGLERKSQLEAAEQKFAKAFQCNPDLMVISTLDEGRYVEVNDAFVEITGYTRDETIGHTAQDIGIWAVAEERESLVEKIRKNGSIRDFEIQLRLKSGKIRIFSLTGEIIDLEGMPHLLNSSRDITESKQTMEELSFPRNATPKHLTLVRF